MDQLSPHECLEILKTVFHATTPLKNREDALKYIEDNFSMNPLS